MTTTIITNIGRLVTMDAREGRDGKLGVIKAAGLILKDGTIDWVGQDADLPSMNDVDVVDAQGLTVMPGLIDCHTHLVHAGSRQNEFNLRSEGKTYREIAADGGGIMSTVRATREADIESLFAEASARADEAMDNGITTIEIKTGYGLDLDNELKMAEVIEMLSDDHPIEVVGTFLGAHVVPIEYMDKRHEYVDIVINEMLPEIAKTKCITGCDVFVEDIAYSKGEAEKICRSAKELGLEIHLHVDQFTDGGGAKLAASLGAMSADHLDYTSDAGFKDMSKAGTVGVVLPGASFFTGGGHYPNVKSMIENDVKVAVATDYNPGTTPSLDLFLNASIAITQMGMSCDDALLGITKNAAAALGLGDRGVIKKGTRADLIFLNSPDEYYPLYRYGANYISAVFIDGNSVLT